jgi:hypothetical protein
VAGAVDTLVSRPRVIGHRGFAVLISPGRFCDSMRRHRRINPQNANLMNSVNCRRNTRVVPRPASGGARLSRYSKATRGKEIVQPWGGLIPKSELLLASTATLRSSAHVSYRLAINNVVDQLICGSTPCARGDSSPSMFKHSKGTR